MRTDDEIVARINELETAPVDFFGTERTDLIGTLPFERARPFLKPGYDGADWEATPRDHDSVKARMFDYMPFAWGKANNARGLSAARSLNHMRAWLWLLGEDAAAEQIAEYDRYGKPQLRAICESFGWDWRQWDDGHWGDSEDGLNSGVPEKVEPLNLAS